MKLLASFALAIVAFVLVTGELARAGSRWEE